MPLIGRSTADLVTAAYDVERRLRVVSGPERHVLVSREHCRRETRPPSAAALLSPDLGSQPLRGSDPATVDVYRLVSRLGVGGTADVFEAVSPAGHPVVVKVLRASAGVSATCRREFRLHRSAGTDVTAPALGHGVSEAGAYLVTAYLPDHRCATALAGGAMPTDRLLELGSALSTALAAIHSRGVVHCDVKPANLLVRADDDDVRLIDFGIARYVDEQAEVDGTVQYSPGWAAPEQRAGAPATAAVDVFAWGRVLAYLATGIHPFSHSQDSERALEIPSVYPSTTPAALGAIIRAALAPDPVDRPSAQQLAEICGDECAARRSADSEDSPVARTG